MFEHELTESLEKCVKMKDVEAKVFKEMLRFFYTGQVDNFMEIGTRLYEMADRYLADSLKDYCVRGLIRGVNKDNAIELYCFARAKEIEDLTKKTTEALIEYVLAY